MLFKNNYFESIIRGITLIPLSVLIFLLIGQVSMAREIKSFEEQTIVEIAQANPDFSILVEAVVKAELVDALSGEGPFTVFAPNNDAFENLFNALGVSGVADLTKEQLTPILLYHVLSGKVLSSDLAPGQVVSMLSGQSATVLKNDGKVTINGISVIAADIEASNGAIHVINEVILPNTIVDIALGNEDFSILVEAVVKAELVETLASGSPFTVFAPTNSAFEKLFSALGISGIQDLTKEQLTPILLYHVLGANVLSTDLSNGQRAATLFGNDISVHVNSRDGSIRINDSKVVAANIGATNGVIHVINRVLIPPGNVESYTLVNADTDEDIQEVQDGDVIDLADLGTSNLNIRANIVPMTTGSVRFYLDGKDLRTENIFPYALFSDDKGDYKGWTPETRDYTINAVPFSKSFGKGIEGTEKSITVSFTDSRTIVEIAQSNPNFSILVDAVVKAGLATALQGDGPFTVFAPTNSAFEKLFHQLGVNGVEDLSAEQLTPILLYHVLGAKVLSGDLSNGQVAETLFGNNVEVTIDAHGNIRVNNAHVIIKDVVASNGVIHAINSVLIPPGKVESYTLVNAETDEDIQEIKDGDIIDLNTLDTDKLNIRANINPAVTGSVKFYLNGKNLRTENAFPYALFSDSKGDYKNWTPQPGEYLINATPFSQRFGKGIEGTNQSITISFIDSRNIVDIAQANPNFSILVEAVVKAGLVEALQADGPFTVFAPTNSAFEHLFKQLGINGVEDLTVEQLTPILLYHVLGIEVLSKDLSNGQEAETLFGNNVKVNIDAHGNIRVNNSHVILKDVQASNGVIHVINRVLIPPGKVVGYTLVNADTDEDIQEIKDGDVINLNDLETKNLNIRANIVPMNTGSVKFYLNGQDLRTENAFPYALFSDTQGDYKNWTPEPGEYTINAVPYTERYARGIAGSGMEISVTFTEPNTIVDIARSNPDFSILYDAVVKAELGAALASDGPFTVFAPTNAAFEKLFMALGISGVADLSKEDLTPILLYHALAGQILAGDLAAGQTVTTLGGGSAVVLKNDMGVTINDVHVVVPDVLASNGVIHVINDVLIPRNIVEIASANDDFSILVEAVVKAELVDALSGDGPLTVFAPTNEAFNALFSELGVSGVKDLTKDQLTPILLYHVLGANILSTDLSDGASATTLQGKDVQVSIENGKVFINESEVVVANIGATNGVIHVINKVLLPPSDGNAISNPIESSGAVFSLYPNPTQDRLNIRAELKDKTYHVTIMDSNGKVYFSKDQRNNSNIDNLNVDLSGYPKGLYIVKLKAVSGSQTIRLYKQ
ncbi:fasciclin domain-containing protein [Fulvivirgaceae bacterium BMA10]|uniref:Fasciclin domain-containing protein n=1 Tax=Splendidivirga corallicola TaxID=3051826 RepID=A0ABT8KQJ7_9BACT|nr:fasciclin domain-containing protein [Fulvivirgaceae bacterium BMA10]